MTKFLNEDDKYIALKITSVPLDQNTKSHVIQEVVSGNIRYIFHNDILDQLHPSIQNYQKPPFHSLSSHGTLFTVNKSSFSLTLC